MLGYSIMGLDTQQVSTGDAYVNYASGLMFNHDFYDYREAGTMSSGSTPSPCTYSQSSVDDSQESTSVMSVSPPLSVTLSPRSLQNLINMTADEQLANNIIPLEKTTGIPYLRILEQPNDKFRFRYKSEMMGTHGSLLGKTGDRNRKKTYPTVELCNYDGPAIIRCALYTAQGDKRLRTPHTHRLVVRLGNEDIDDPHEIAVNRQIGYTAVFQGMGVIHTARKHISDELLKKKRARMLEQMRLKNINVKQLSVRDDAKLRAETELEAKKMNLNVVTLFFECFIKKNDLLVPLCDPIYSVPINNMKSALTGELKICRMDKHVSSCLGNEEVFIFVEKVGKKNIRVKVYELDDEDNEIWCDYGKFSELEVHHQYAIAFRTPPYRDTEIEDKVQVFIQLYRPSDGDCSEPLPFAYKPSEKTAVHTRKRPRLNEDYPLSDSRPLVTVPDLNILDKHPSNGQTPSESPFPSLDDLLIDNPEYESAEFQKYLSNLSMTEYLATLEKDAKSFADMGPVDMDLTTDGASAAQRKNQFSAAALSNAMKLFNASRSKTLPSEKPSKQSKTPVAAPGESVLENLLKRTSNRKSASAYKGPSVKEVGEVVRDKAPKRAATSNIGDKDKDVEKDRDMFLKKVTSKLIEISRVKHTKTPRALVSLVKDLFSMKSDEGDTALHMAIGHDDQKHLGKYLEVLGARESFFGSKQTVNLSAVLDISNDNQETALHLAVLQNQPKTIAALLSGGANPNRVNKTGDTPVHLAVNFDHTRCLSELLNEANYEGNLLFMVRSLNVKNEQGWTPLHLATLKHNLSAVIDLCDRGADPNIVDRTSGRTVLHIAVEEQDVPIVRHLLDKTDVDIDRENLAGYTALHIASVVGDNGSDELCDMLLVARVAKQVRIKTEEVDGEELTRNPAPTPVRSQQKEPVRRMTVDSPVSEPGCKGSEIKLEPEDLEEEVVEEEVIEEEVVEEEVVVPRKRVSFDPRTLATLCKILDANNAWEDLAQVLELSFLIGGIKCTESPTQALLNYADLHGEVSVRTIHESLIGLKQMAAVEAIDQMLARRASSVRR